jgi:anti-sigma regulatory factor (Ser/Thr protein kinase)
MNDVMPDCRTAVACRPFTGAPHASIALLAHPQNIAVARHFVSATLKAWGAEADTEATAVLVVSELATNAAVHGGTEMTVEIALAPELLTVVVADRRRGVGDGPVGSELPDDEHGRGLMIVQAMADDYDAKPEASGWRTRVAFRM